MGFLVTAKIDFEIMKAFIELRWSVVEGGLWFFGDDSFMWNSDDYNVWF